MSNNSLDKRDHQLLALLAKDARIPHSQLAKEMRIHRQTVANRIHSLEENGVIKGYEAVINFFRLGLIHYECFYTFHDFTQDNRERYIKYFTEHPHTRWVGEALAQPHLRVNFLAVSNQHFEEIITQIEKALPGEIKDFEFNVVLEHVKNMPGVHDPNDPKALKAITREEMKRLEPFLDEKDITLLQALSNDPRRSLLELAGDVDMSVEGARQRKKRLEEQRVILKYTVNIDVEKVESRMWAILYCRVNGRDDELDRRIMQFLRLHPAVSNTHKMFGDWHYSISLLGDTVYDINDAVQDLMGAFSQNVPMVRLVTMFRGYKYPKIGNGVFDILRSELQNRTE